MTRGRKWSKNIVVSRIKALEKKLGKRPVKRDASTLYQKSREFFGTWNNALYAAGYTINKKQIPRIPDLSIELCYFAGIVSTDGHLYCSNGKSRKVLIYTSYPDECKMVARLIDEIFQYRASVKVRRMGWNKRNNYEIYISSKPIVEFLNKKFNIPLGPKSKTITIPIIFESIRPEFAWNYLRGVLDGDGDILQRDYLVRISSGSMAYLEGLRNMLEKLGIKSTSIKKEKTAFRLYIYGKENIVKISSKLYPATFCYKRKRNMFVKLLRRASKNYRPAVAQTDSSLHMSERNRGNGGASGCRGVLPEMAEFFTSRRSIETGRL